jgi:hypothetical protein
MDGYVLENEEIRVGTAGATSCTGRARAKHRNTGPVPGFSRRDILHNSTLRARHTQTTKHCLLVFSLVIGHCSGLSTPEFASHHSPHLLQHHVPHRPNKPRACRGRSNAFTATCEVQPLSHLQFPTSTTPLRRCRSAHQVLAIEHPELLLASLL